jgi:hypothetical protein
MGFGPAFIPVIEALAGIRRFCEWQFAGDAFVQLATRSRY